jgi:hypothetical protein
VVSEVRGGSGAEELGVRVSPGDSLLGGGEEGELEDGEDGATSVGGHGLDDPEGVAPADVETQDDGADGVLGVVGGDTLTGGEGLTGGWVLWSLPPVSPRCRAIQS